MAVTVTPWNDLTSQNSEESNADIEKNSNLQGVLKKVPVALQSGMGAPRNMFSALALTLPGPDPP